MNILIEIALDLLRAAYEAEKLDGDARAEAERQALILAQRKLVMTQAKRDFKG